MDAFKYAEKWLRRHSYDRVTSLDQITGGTGQDMMYFTGFSGLCAYEAKILDPEARVSGTDVLLNGIKMKRVDNLSTCPACASEIKRELAIDIGAETGGLSFKAYIRRKQKWHRDVRDRLGI